MAKAFQHLFKERGKKPFSIQTDQGNEFFNTNVAQLFKTHNVNLFAVKSQYKAALVERFNRTLKTRMFRYFTHIGKHRWFDVLDKFIDSYNNTPHRSLPLRMTPNEARLPENAYTVWLHQ